jgi:membrane-bound lytic murein transglycosylase D
MFRSVAQSSLTALWLIVMAGSTAFGAEASTAASAKPSTATHGAKGAPKPAPKTKQKPTAPPKPKAKPHAKATKAPPRKPVARKGPPGEADENIRRSIAGTSNSAIAPGQRTDESPELRAMRELDHALFPSAAPQAGVWSASGLDLNPDGPRLVASGMPPGSELTASADPAAPAPPDLTWLKELVMPDIPVRWDARVVRYLQFYRDNPRGRSMVQTWLRKSGRYGGAIRGVLRDQGLPEDVLWLALVESGFNPSIYSPVGAAGLWQFMPAGARIYGLKVDRWVDERLDPERATIAAAKHLADLRQRFGGWELAFAAYNMGYGGLLAAIRKYNTNDFWELSRFEAGVPFETALYVPKIIAMAIVARNKDAFGCADVELDPAVTFDKIAVGSGVSLRSVAAAAGTTESAIDDLNPQLLANRTPPTLPGTKDVPWIVRVPPGAGARAAKEVPKAVLSEEKLARYLVRWGETITDIAAAQGTTRAALQSLNGLRRDEVLRPGTVLFVPAPAGAGAAVTANLLAESSATRPVVVVPAQTFSFPDRRRAFYRTVTGDTLPDIASVLSVSLDQLCHWNLLDPSVALHDGMTLQAFIPKDRTLPGVLLLEEADAQVLTAGSEAFFAHFEALKGRERVEIVVKKGDSFRALAKKHGLTMGMLERINQRSRWEAIEPGERLVVYVPGKSPSAPEATPDTSEVAVAAVDESAEAKDSAAKGDEAGDDEPVKPAVLRANPEPKPEKAAPASRPGSALLP